MGLPLSRFQMLAGLCSQDEYVRKALAPFKLFCIVLHDPDDKKFSGKMQRHFLDLHTRTGENLLFITFINPPAAWTPPEGLSFPEMERRALSGERGFDSWLVINHFLPGVAPDAELPCLLVTHDMQAREYLLLGSSLDRVETQLEELGRISSSLDVRVPVSDERILAFASHLGACRLMKLPERSLAEELTDTLALQAYGADSPGAEAWVDKRIAELRAAKEGVAGDGMQARYDKYEAAASRIRQKTVASVSGLGSSALAEDIFDSFSMPRPRGTRRPARSHDIGLREPTLYSRYYIRPESVHGYDLCDVRSRCNIKEYNDSLGVFKRCRDEDNLVYWDEARTMLKSYKQQALPLAEFFEREINRTLVQFMRWHCGIEMPEYYQKHKENVYRYVLSGDYKVYLNAHDGIGRLKRLTIGDAYYAYKAMSEQYDRYHLRDPMGDAFLQDWFHLLHFRNGVGHADFFPDEFFGYAEFRQMHSVLLSIFEGSLLKMETIGATLRDGAPVQEEASWPGFFRDDRFE